MNEQVFKYLKEISNYSLKDRRVKCSNYKGLDSEIPDEYLILESVFEESDLEEIFENFKPYIGESNICPIIEVLGGNVICIGYSSENNGVVYYYDVEFGLFELEKTFSEFEKKLI